MITFAFRNELFFAVANQTLYRYTTYAVVQAVAQSVVQALHLLIPKSTVQNVRQIEFESMRGGYTDLRFATDIL